MNNLRESPHLKKYYSITLEIGLIIVLAMGIIAFQTDFSGNNSSNKAEYRYIVNQESYIDGDKFLELETTPELESEEVIPPPPPEIPAVEPEEELMDDIADNFDIDLDLPLETEKMPIELPYIHEEMDYFLAAQEMPDLENGWPNFHKDVIYPEYARQRGIQGRVYLQFIVNERGEVEDPVVLRGIGGGCDEAALRAVKEARFVPGYIHGKPVRVKIGMAVKFQLNRLTGLPEHMIREVGG